MASKRGSRSSGARSPHLDVDEADMFDSKLTGDYKLHDEAHSPIHGGGDTSARRSSKSTGGSHGGGGGGNASRAESKWGGTRLQPSLTISENSSEVFCVRFSPDGKFLSAGCADGAIRVFSVDTGRLSYNLLPGSSQALPCTALRFRPLNSISKTRNVLVAVTATGAIQHWHVTSGKCLSTIASDTQFYALDFRTDGSIFGATGKDHSVRIYDETSKQETCRMAGGAGYGSSSTSGHSNRVFSLKFVKNEPDMVVTGGWDNTVQFWDIRAGHSVRSIYGPHISGDSLDICGKELLTGSWRPDDPLELWDYGSGRKIETIPWSTLPGSASRPTLLYAAQFSSLDGGCYIAAGGSGANEAKVFDHRNGNTLVGTVAGLSRGVFTLDFSPATEGPKKLAVGGGDASIRIIDIVEEDSYSMGEDEDL